MTRLYKNENHKYINKCGVFQIKRKKNSQKKEEEISIGINLFSN